MFILSKCRTSCDPSTRISRNAGLAQDERGAARVEG
jgi:hypothetical protein